MAQIIDGKAVSAAVKAEVAEETAKLRDEKGLKVGLAVVIVGNDPASRVYVNNKKKACEACESQQYGLESAHILRRFSIFRKAFISLEAKI